MKSLTPDDGFAGMAPDVPLAVRGEEFDVEALSV
jgi:hypothetical protein